MHSRTSDASAARRHRRSTTRTGTARSARHERAASASPRCAGRDSSAAPFLVVFLGAERSEEHTSELQSLMRISYAVFCLKKKKQIEIRHISNNKKRNQKTK